MGAVTVVSVAAFITQSAAAHECLSTSAAVLPTGCLCLSLTSCKKTSFIKTEPLGSAGASAAKEL